MKINHLAPILAATLLSCNSKQTDPQPQASPSGTLGKTTQPASSRTTSSTYMEFQLFDAADGDQFNTALNARVFYFPSNYTDSQIKSYFGNPDTNANWDSSPRAADEEFDFDNVVAPVYGWSAQPGFVHLDFVDRQPGQRIAIVWLYVDANPNCRRGYREQLFIWNGLGENYRLYTDQYRAGL